MQFYEDQGEGEVHSYIFIPSKHSLPIISFLYPLAIKNYSTSVLRWVLSESPLEVELFFFLFPE